MIAVVARTKTWRKHCREILLQWPENIVPKLVTKYYTKLAPVLYYQGFLSIFGYFKKVIGFIIGLKRPVPRWPSSNADMVTWAVKSCALAAENLMLAFRAYGYDTCPMEGFDSRRVKKLIKLPSDAIPVMIIAAGKRAVDGIYFPQLRFDKENFVHEA
jgi:nitroreductase